ncbi:MAG: hypothetical protein JWP12_883 [Bacteroidetes bacterium]|nr:hypothetical protein [Bacteroidota bacterium]
MKKIILFVTMSALMASCQKKTCTCTEKQYSHDKDVANQVSCSDSDRAEYKYTIGQSAMTHDGASITYTKEYIEQQQHELEATGKFNCDWSY